MIVDRPANEAKENNQPAAAEGQTPPGATPDGQPAPGAEAREPRQRRLFGKREGPTAAERFSQARSLWIERRRRDKPSIPTWPRRRPVRWLRRALISALLIPLMHVGYRLEVRGKHNFRLVQEPAIIVSNHNMHLDAALLVWAMPAGFRQRTSFVAAAEDIYGNRVRGFFASLLGNAFPLATEGAGVREGLENIVGMLEQRWNIIIFPEGELTVVGPMKRFKAGTGRIAMETGVQVLPMRIDVLRRGFYEGKWFPHPRARVRISVGEPFLVPEDARHIQATRMLEDAVRNA